MDPVSKKCSHFETVRPLEHITKPLSPFGKSLLLKISSAMFPYNDGKFSIDIDFS